MLLRAPSVETQAKAAERCAPVGGLNTGQQQWISLTGLCALCAGLAATPGDAPQDQSVNALAQQLAQTLLRAPSSGTQAKAAATAPTSATFQSPAVGDSVPAFALKFVPQQSASPGSASPSPSPFSSPNPSPSPSSSPSPA